MDPNLIYVKTVSGENAIQQRTRVIQRNVRMVLILVDGQLSVADLVRKTGNLQLTESALAELEKGGFIEPKVEQHDSLWEESKRVAQEIRSAAEERAAQFSATEEGHKRYPDFKQDADSPRAFDHPKSRLPDVPISLHSIFDAREEMEFSSSRFSLPPGLAASMQATSGKAPRRVNNEPMKPKPVRHTAGGGTSWLAWLFFGFVGALALGCVSVLLFPFSIFVPNLETAFSSAVGQPVGIQEVRVNVYPAPMLVLGGVRLGQGSDTIQVREIRLQPDPGSLFSERKVFRKAVISGTELQLERIAGMPAIFASLSDPEKSPKIGRFLFENTEVSFSGMAVKNAEAEIRLDAEGNMQALAIRSEDGSLTLIAEPAAAGIDLTADAFGWRPGADSKFYADSLNFKGRLEKDTLTISGLEMRVLDGLIQGDAIVRGGAKPNLSGTAAFERINASKLGDALGIGKKLAGGLAGKLRFTAASEIWPEIFSSIDGEGEFNIQRGSLYGLDLAEAARRVSGAPVQGGMTAFEQMSGRMRLTREKDQFYGLSITSGLMQSTGYIDVARKEQGRLTGRLELQMKGSMNQTRMPLLVSGTLDMPAVQVMGRQ